ncbi:protein traS [Escherichia coli]|nr:protein traS [Escherichia coli]TPD02094.1 protein traS [Escherichia coli]
MKRSELERDAAYIFDKFKNLDYEIPSNIQIMKVIFSKLVIVYVLQLVFIFIDVLLNSSSGEYHYFDTVVLVLGSNIFFSLAFLMVTYHLVCMQLALGKEIISQSVLLKLVEKKIRFYSLFLLSVNTIVGCILLWVGERFVAGLGFSWFLTFIVSVLCLQGSLSRYMTPAVVSSLSKVKELLSVSPK